MIKFEGEFSVDTAELKEMIKDCWNTPRPKNYEEQKAFLAKQDELHKRFLEVFDGKFIKIGPYDWNRPSTISKTDFKKCLYRYVALKGFEVFPKNGPTDGIYQSTFRIESGAKYIFDYKDSICISYFWHDFGVYARSNASVQKFTFERRPKSIKIWEISKEEFDRINAQAFDIDFLQNNCARLWNARDTSNLLTKDLSSFKDLKKQENLLKEQIVLIRMKQDLLCYKQLLANSQNRTVEVSDDEIYSVLEISAKASIDQMTKEIEEEKKKLTE